MISMSWDSNFRSMTKSIDPHIGALAAALMNLPPHIGKKHMLASMRRAIKASGGVARLRAATPPIGTRRGRRRKGEKRISTGALRRAVTTKARWIGNNKSGAAVAGLGYKYGWESRKAIWHEFGTTRMAAKRMMDEVFNQIRGPVASRLVEELRVGLERAAAELASGKNPGYKG